MKKAHYSKLSHGFQKCQNKARGLNVDQNIIYHMNKYETL
jgi:hypothetical protein